MANNLCVRIMRTASLDNRLQGRYSPYRPTTRWQPTSKASGCMRQQDKNFTNPMQAGTDSESLLRLIVNKTPALIYNARPEGYIDFFNQQCVEFLGLPLEDIS